MSTKGGKPDHGNAAALSQYSIWNTGNLFLTIYGMDTGDDMETVHSTIESNIRFS